MTIAAAASRASTRRAADLTISADQPSGSYAAGFEVRISASDPQGNPVTVFYTEDGTDPSDSANPTRHRFTGSQSFTISDHGNKVVFCYARDAAGNEIFEPFAWHVHAAEPVGVGR